ncbi:MAG: hypothetical protein V3T58_02545 [Candidatus Hydrothermarchaeales archaeon]
MGVKAPITGAIVGGVLGLSSGIYTFISGVGGFAGYATPRTFLGNLFTIPTIMGMYVHDAIFHDYFLGSWLNLLLPLTIFPILIGALIGIGVGRLIGKYNLRRVPD